MKQIPRGWSTQPLLVNFHYPEKQKGFLVESSNPRLRAGPMLISGRVIDKKKNDGFFNKTAGS